MKWLKFCGEFVFLGSFLNSVCQYVILQFSIICVYLSALSAGAVEYTDCISAEGVRHHHPTNDCPGYDSEQSDGEAPVMLKLWGIWNTPSLPLLPALLLPEW